MSDRNRSSARLIAPALLIALAACGAPRAVPPDPALASAIQSPPPAGESVVWTAVENKPINTPVGVVVLPHPLTRLEVLGRGPAGLAVSCRYCEPAVSGYIDESDLVTTAYPPEAVASASLAEFALAVRDAALRHDLDALRPVMAPDFSYDFVGIQSPEAAFDVWRSENFRSLDDVPGLLDRGLTTDDRELWVSPPAFLNDLNYRGPRLGFRRRADGRWEWLFLIRGIS